MFCPLQEITKIRERCGNTVRGKRIVVSPKAKRKKKSYFAT